MYSPPHRPDNYMQSLKLPGTHRADTRLLNNFAALCTLIIRSKITSDKRLINANSYTINNMNKF
jgi:hypothetical protein